jgi:hypothetical protein
MFQHNWHRNHSQAGTLSNTARDCPPNQAGAGHTHTLALLQPHLPAPRTVPEPCLSVALGALMNLIPAARHCWQPPACEARTTERVMHGARLCTLVMPASTHADHGVEVLRMHAPDASRQAQQILCVPTSQMVVHRTKHPSATFFSFVGSVY